MQDCCDNLYDVESLGQRQKRTLVAVLAINAVMFVVVLLSAFYANSSALLSDSLDNLGDALTYGLSLYAVSRGAHTKASVALFKGALIFLAALGVLLQITYKLLYPVTPLFQTMGMVGLLALAANGLCLTLLWKHRHEDVNMSSVWECSRNDVAGNVAVLVAAAGVWMTSAQWPDLLVGTLLAVLLLRSGVLVVRESLARFKVAV